MILGISVTQLYSIANAEQCAVLVAGFLYSLLFGGLAVVNLPCCLGC